MGAGHAAFLYAEVELKQKKFGGKRFRLPVSSAFKPMFKLSKIVERKCYNTSAINDIQGLVTFLLLFMAIGAPWIIRSLSPEDQGHFQGYMVWIQTAKQDLTMFTIMLYSSFSMFPGFQFLTRPFGNKDDNVVADFRNGFTFMVILIGFAIPVAILAIFVALIGYQISESILGGDFALFISFFVFPLWITRIYALICSMILLSLPDGIFVRYEKIVFQKV